MIPHRMGAIMQSRGVKVLDIHCYSHYIYSCRGGVAQLEEQRNHNPRVRGSSPCAATIDLVFFWNAMMAFHYRKVIFI